MDFNVIGGNENAVITIKEKQDGDILYLFVNMNLPMRKSPKSFRLNGNSAQRTVRLPGIRV